MKNIHVLLLDYSNSFALNQALSSLNLIYHHIKDIVIMKEANSQLKHSNSSINHEINYIQLLNDDLGMTLNEYIKTLSYDYTLFLYDQDYFTSEIKDVKLELSDNQPIMTCPYIIKNNTIQRPFLVKTSFLKQTNFFSKYQIPFKETLLSSWLSKLNKSCVINQKGNFINQTRSDKTICMLQKLNFIEKYQYETEKDTKQPSISVMISNYNMAEYVGIAVNSCLMQNNPPEQILVIDDGSTDNSYKELEAWNTFPEVKFFRKNNEGKARALNDLLPYIKTDFVVELDADDWFDPDAFSVIRKYLTKLSDDVNVLYGNLRIWRQISTGIVKYKRTLKGKKVNNKNELLSYQFPLGPRIYRTSSLRKNNGFPIIKFENGRMYEDVSILNKLLKEGCLLYQDFTVYNVRDHPLSITKKKSSNWSDFLKYLD
ncbi:glycosyltransferase family 2 protein [Priestia megaterium]